MPDSQPSRLPSSSSSSRKTLTLIANANGSTPIPPSLQARMAAVCPFFISPFISLSYFYRLPTEDPYQTQHHQFTQLYKQQIHSLSLIFLVVLEVEWLTDA